MAGIPIDTNTEFQPLPLMDAGAKKDSAVEDTNNVHALALAVTEAANNGDSVTLQQQKMWKDVLAAEGFDASTDDVMRQYNQKVFDEYTAAVQGIVDEERDESVKQFTFEAFLEAVPQDLMSNDPYGALNAMLVSLGAGDDEDSKLYASQVIAEQMAAELGKSTGILDTIGDFGGTLIPLRPSFDLLTDKLEVPGMGKMNMDDLRRLYSISNASERVKMLPTIADFVNRATDNNIYKQEYFSRITGLEGGSFVREAAISAALDIGFELLPGGLIAGGLKRSLRGIKGLKVLKGARTEAADKLAGELNAASLESTEAATSVGSDLATAQGNTTGWRLEQLFPDQTDGLGADTVRAIDERVQEVQEHLQGTVFKGHNLFTEEERANAIARWKDGFQEKWLNAGDGIDPEKYAIDDVQFNFDSTLTGFKATVRTPDATYHFKPVNVIADDLGKFETSEIPSYKLFLTKIASPASILRHIHENYVSTATTLDRQVAHNVRALTAAVKVATKGLGKKGSEKLDAVLLAGDNPGAIDGRLFTPNQLMLEGVDTGAGHIRLNEKEVSAYYATRRVFDELHRIEDARVARSLEFEGYKRINFYTEDAVSDTFQAYGKEVSNFDNDVQRVWNASTKSVTAIDDELVQEGLANGSLKRVQFYSPVKVSKGEHIEHIKSAVVREADLKDIGSHGVLNYRTGYVPLARKNVNFVVRRAIKTTVDGTEKTIHVAERLFNTEVDANAWIEKELTRLGKQEGETAEEFFTRSGETLVTTRDRQLIKDPAAASELALTRMGGLYGSSRVQRQLLYGLDGDTPVRLSAIEAVRKNLSHAAHAGTFNEFRMSAISKLTNTYGPKGLNVLRDPGDPLNSAVSPVASAATRKAIEQQQRYLRTMLRIPTPEESTWEGTLNAMAGWMENVNVLKDSKARDVVLDFRNKNPLSWAKTAVFHSMLGMYNFSQLWVQASGAIPAMSIHPTRIIPLLARYNALRSVLYFRKAGNMEAVNGVAEKLGSFLGRTSGLSKQQFLDMVEHFHETGIADSIKTSADYDAILNSFNADKGLFARVADSGLLFYREGELFTRAYGWLTAYDEYLRKFPGKVGKLTEFDKEKIMARGQTIVLNMDRANAAWWQHAPVISNATQFLQVHLKAVEAILGNELSRADRIKFLVGSLVASGARGLPFGTAATFAAAKFYGANPDTFDESTRAAITDGAQGLAMYWITGIPVEAASRTSIAQGIEEIWQQYTMDEATLVDVMMGPLAVINERVSNAYRMSGAILAPVYEDFSQFDPTMTLEVASEWAKIATSFNKAAKARMIYKLGHVTDGNGNLLFSVDEDNRIPQAIIHALGFTSTREAYNWIAVDDLKAISKEEKNVADTLVQLFRKYEDQFDDEGTYKRYRLAATLALRSIEDYPESQQRVLKSVQDRLTNPREREIMNRILHKQLEGRSTKTSIFSPQTAP